MLIDVQLQTPDPFFAILFGKCDPIHHQTGVYEINHHNGDSLLPDGFEKYPDLYAEGSPFFGAYGVADSYQQVLEKVVALNDPARKFVLMFCPVKKADQPEDGGWRWHKWGSYIGAHDPQCEYLYDEEGIEQVICFHIFEKV